MGIVVVEPHCDDAFLSLGHHIEKIWKDEDVTILTVFNDEKRGKEAQAYADAVGAESVCLNLPLTNMSSDDKPKRIPELEEWVDSNNNNDFYFPLGLQHPDHLSVARCGNESIGEFFYVDTPYQTKQKNSEALEIKILDTTIASICWPGKRKWKHIPIFKSQAKFFHFNPVQDWKLPEIIVQ